MMKFECYFFFFFFLNVVYNLSAKTDKALHFRFVLNATVYLRLFRSNQERFWFP